jgi:ribonuclease J
VGFISVVVVVDSSTGQLTGGPEIHARGSGIDPAQFEEFIPQIERALAEKAADGVVDMQEIRRVVRRTVGRWVSDTYRRRPMIIPVVLEV